MKFHPTAALLTFAASLLVLAGCGGPEQEGTVPREESATPAALQNGPEAEEPVSIIRPDVAPAPIVDLPPEPLVVTISFPEGSKLDEAAEGQLASILEAEALTEDWPIVLRGHSDSSGGDAANLRASRRRAEAVAAWFIERGIREERIRITPFGEQNPMAPNANPDGTPNEQGRLRNRRVEVIVSPPGNATAEEGDTAIEEATGRDTAVEQAIEGLRGVDTP